MPQHGGTFTRLSTLKLKQHCAMATGGRVTFVSLPEGYKKSFVYQVLPDTFHPVVCCISPEPHTISGKNFAYQTPTCYVLRPLS